MTAISCTERILGGLWGSLVGDALGVPVEFIDRATLHLDPVKGMKEFGTHHQPRGTWSDDGSMILCTVDSLLNQTFNLDDMGNRFVRWMNEGFWTPYGDVFDMGSTTASALMRIARGTSAGQAGGQSEESNGNGSLMRILPIAVRFCKETTESFVSKLEQASTITHAHARSQMTCVFFGFMTGQLLAGDSPSAALITSRAKFTEVYKGHKEFGRFNHILNDHFETLTESEIVSTGYSLHTLHASLWSLLTTNSFSSCVLNAVNLGGDSDTTGCVAGGLAGITYGQQHIPADWMQCLARKQDIDDLFTDFTKLCL